MTCLRCLNLGVTLHDPGVTLHYRRFRKNSYWGRDTHVLSSQDVWRDDTSPRHYLLIEMVVLHHHFYLPSQSRLPTTGSRQDDSVDSPVSRTCSGSWWASECGRSGSGLLNLPSLTLGRLWFPHFDAKKNGKSNVNKLEMENEPYLVPIICQIPICVKTRSKSV